MAPTGEDLKRQNQYYDRLKQITDEEDQARSAGLSKEDRLAEMENERVQLYGELSDEITTQGEQTERALNFREEIAKLDQQIIPLEQQITQERIQQAITDQKGADRAGREIQQSQDRLLLDQLDIQIRAAANKGDEYGAFLLQNQSNILKINFDYEEKIQKALDDANISRQKGLDLTAEEDEFLAQQLETEKQAALALEQQRQEQERLRISQGPSPLTINALAQGNLRLGATSDVYAAALAASENLKPGSPAYEQLVQRITAEDQLRMLQGKNLSFADQLSRDKLVQWYTDQQQQKANQAGATSHQQEIDYWQAIAQGRMPAAGNPYLDVFGTPNLTTGSFTAPLSQSQTTEQLQSQIDILQNLLTEAQKTNRLLTPVNVSSF
jgi:hypothetical protein